jgi:F-type H+-transporting ATPase subunit epsilon
LAKAYPLEIVTLKKTTFSEDVECVTVPGGLGYLGILAGHAPLLTNVEAGVISIRPPEGPDIKMAVGEGFLVVTPQSTTLLVDTAERKEDVDVERARAAMDRARERLAAPHDEIDLARAEASLKRAMARLKLAGAV